MNFLKIILVIIYSFLYTTSVFAETGVSVVYDSPANTTEYEIKKKLKSSDAIKSVVSLINDNFNLPEHLEFFFGGEDGPLYNSEENKIVIPYSFVTEVKNHFIKANYSETGISSSEATMDALMHTMIHEFAHSIIFMHELPVLGKEEDAADALATVLLIEFFKDGQEIAISAADLFDLESDDKKVLDEEDFWDEHSLDVKRYYSTLCHVYGSNPEEYTEILENKYFTEERAEFCVAEYENISQSWFVLLTPHMKHNSVNSANRKDHKNIGDIH